jgi:hypothetical protein
MLKIKSDANTEVIKEKLMADITILLEGSVIKLSENLAITLINLFINGVGTICSIEDILKKDIFFPLPINMEVNMSGQRLIDIMELEDSDEPENLVGRFVEGSSLIN